MRKALLRSFQLVGVAAWIAVVPIPSMADDGNGVEPSIEGVWVSNVITSVNPPASTYSLNTFLADGKAIEDNSGSSIRSVGHGEWERVGSREFMRTIYILQFTSAHVFTRMTKVSSHFELDHGGDEYYATSVFETYDLNGSLVATGRRTAHAKRCTAFMTVPQCMGLAS